MVISRPPLYQACIPPRTTKAQFSSRYSQPRPQVYRGFNGPPGWLRITPVVALAHPCSQSSLWCQNEPASSHTLDCRASSASICEHLCSQPCQLLFMKFELYSFVGPLRAIPWRGMSSCRLQYQDAPRRCSRNRSLVPRMLPARNHSSI